MSCGKSPKIIHCNPFLYNNVTKIEVIDLPYYCHIHKEYAIKQASSRLL
ncbi:hypothetical protein HMPREF0973_00684 [Prevotella veroralis F0319]|uniref:Uncharacterized protein n=1 Tax=Prevotella veroralis F0319 TaxID=649761 RepID=C9MM54_9BACT|nr:hypothetical protein HMPREF0973_00684 [Prevotella veroralis F0319]